MPEQTFWLYWICLQCGQKDIRGDNKVCPKCGHQQDHEERLAMEATVNDQMQPRSEVDLVTDQTQLERLKGPGTEDWWCNNCDKSVLFDLECCDVCSAPKDATVEDLMDLRTHQGVRQNRLEHGDDRAILVERLGAMEGREVLAGRGDNSSTGREDALRSLNGEEPPRESGRPPQFVEPRFSLRFIVGVVAGVLVLSALVWLMIWAFSTKEVEGKVSALKWEHMEQIERFTPVTKSDWRSNLSESSSTMPVKGMGEHIGMHVTSCEQRFHHNEQYQCGTHPEQRSREVPDGETCRTVNEEHTRRISDGQKCEDVPKTHYRTVSDGQSCRTTPRTCSSGKNGSVTCSGGDEVCTPKTRQDSYTKYERECEEAFHDEKYTIPVETCTPKTRTVYYSVDVPNYCQRPINLPYCSYETYEWRLVNSGKLNGDGHEMPWPSLQLGQYDRRLMSSEYSVTFAWQEDDKPKSETRNVQINEYSTWKIDDRVIVTLRNVGGTADIQRLNTTNQ
jgi:hypothetical protein